MKKPDGRYRHSLERELREYANEGRDEWDIDTAAESPNALASDPAPRKRSGTYVRADVAKVQEVIERKRECYK